MRTLIASLAAVAVTAVPAAAQAQKPVDVTRVESAVVELAKLKRGSEGRVTAHRRVAQAALAACRSKGPGWARIRRVHDRAQRGAYARGAKRLWAALDQVAAEGAWVEVYTPHFERFLRHFDTPLSDPVLQAGIDAQRHRLAFDQAAYSFGTCETFNRLMKKVREFKIGGSYGVSGDYYAGKIYNDFLRYVPKRQQAAARAHWGSRDDNALEAARNQLKALGGDEGYANYFAFAFKG
jgi:UrcA family protein